MRPLHFELGRKRGNTATENPHHFWSHAPLQTGRRRKLPLIRFAPASATSCESNRSNRNFFMQNVSSSTSHVLAKLLKRSYSHLTKSAVRPTQYRARNNRISRSLRFCRVHPQAIVPIWSPSTVITSRTPMRPSSIPFHELLPHDFGMQVSFFAVWVAVTLLASSDN